jgi:ABC-type multidrug transport system ATPase subunit
MSITGADHGEGTRGIVVDGAYRSFGSVHAVAGVDLTARSGAVTALIGPNGSGKTTLLLMLAGLLVPDAGRMTVDGFDPVTESYAARARVGWMPDAFGTWDSLTAREVLTTVGTAYRMSRDDATGRAAELLETVHLTELADSPARVLSRGQKQRLGLARALVHDPTVLLLDEPAGGLDPRSRVDLRVLLRRLAAEGRTVLVSSHVLTELDEMADDAVFLSHGRTVAAQTVQAAAAARRTWRVRALSASALAAWLTQVRVPWEAEDSFAPPSDAPGALLIELDGERSAAALLTDAVTAGVPVTSLAPVGGALEQTYLSLEEERR